MRSIGNSRPALRMAARTRSRLSRTVESGKPTVLTVGATPPLWLSAGSYRSRQVLTPANLPRARTDRQAAQSEQSDGGNKMVSKCKYRMRVNRKCWSSVNRPRWIDELELLTYDRHLQVRLPADALTLSREEPPVSFSPVAQGLVAFAFGGGKAVAHAVERDNLDVRGLDDA